MSVTSPADTAPAEHPHSHGGQPVGPLSPRAVRFAAVVLAAAAVFTVVAMALLWPDGSGRPKQAGSGPPQVAAIVLRVLTVPCDTVPDQGGHPADAAAPPADAAGPPAGPCGTVTLRLTDGPGAGKEITSPVPAGPGAPRVRPGDRVTLLHTPDSVSGIEYQIADHQRGLQLWMLAVAFAVVVIAFGRWRGLAAMVGLAVTFAVLLLFIVPAIIDGRSPLLVAIVGAAAIMLSVLYLTHGFTMATSVAVLGTLASLALTGLLAAISTAALHLSGVGSEEATYLSIAFRDVNLQGLLLAGIVIGSLGVLDDVAVTQAATVTELAAANPKLSVRQLYHSGLRVGRAHITSVINTIILAYAGASLPLLILIAAGGQPLGEVLTSQLITQEIVRSVVGTIGLVAAVPITTSLAALAAQRIPNRKVADRGDRAAEDRRSRRRPAPAHTSGWLDEESDIESWPGPLSGR